MDDGQTMDGQQMLRHGISSHGLQSGELKMGKKVQPKGVPNNQYFSLFENRSPDI